MSEQRIQPDGKGGFVLTGKPMSAKEAFDPNRPSAALNRLAEDFAHQDRIAAERDRYGEALEQIGELVDAFVRNEAPLSTGALQSLVREALRHEVDA